MIDYNAFYILNSHFVNKPLEQIFWALANVRAMDLYGVIFLTLFLVVYCTDGEKEERRKRWMQCLYVCIWGELGILFTKECVERLLQAYHYMRASPTLVIEPAVLLSEAIPWLKVKDVAESTFPANHAAIVLQWFAFVCVFCPWKYRVMAVPLVVFFIIPRLIGGAHWLSDALVGSGAIVLCIIAWARYSPIWTLWTYLTTRDRQVCPKCD